MIKLKKYSASEVLEVVNYSNDNIKQLSEYFKHYYMVGGDKKDLLLNIRHMVNILTNLHEYSPKEWENLSNYVMNEIKSVII